MSSTAEVKDAIRMAQQYNIHIYKCLINGLVDSSLKVSKFRAELEEYTRSTMRFFDCLYQIRDSKIPFVRVREEQINAFKDHLKKNDYLRQEVHKVQRNLWNMREMGQRVPKADKHMIIQGFPELCVSTRPDNVPLTVLCDQIIHKYNLRNERPIMDMLRWANEQSLARRTSNLNTIRKAVPKPKDKSNHPSELRTKGHNLTPVISHEDVDEINKIQPPGLQAEAHDVTPVMSWEDMDVTDSDQPPTEETDTSDPFKSWVFISLNSVPSTSVSFAEKDGNATKAESGFQATNADDLISEPASRVDENIKRTQEVSLNSVPSTSMLLVEMDGNATKAESSFQPTNADDLISEPARIVENIKRTQEVMLKAKKVKDGNCDMEDSILNMYLTETTTEAENVEEAQPAILSFDDMTSDCLFQETSNTFMPECSNHQKSVEKGMEDDDTFMDEKISVSETPKPTFVKVSKLEDSLNDVMSVLQNIPELDSQYIQPEAAKFKYTCVENMFAPSTMTGLKAEIPAMTKTPQHKEDAGEYRDEQHQNKYNPRLRNVLSWEVLMKRFTKSSESTTTRADANVNTGDTAVKPAEPDNLPKQTDTSEEQVHAAPCKLINVAKLSEMHTATIQNPAVSSEGDICLQMDKNKVGALSGTSSAPMIEFQRPLTKQIQPLVGCDRPHVYENKIKRRQHTPKTNTETMTAAEFLDYQKRREEQLQELELKKMRTMSILNQQFSKNNNCKSAVHYYKVQNMPKADKACKMNPTAIPSQYRPPVSQASSNTASRLNNQTSRKRPATLSRVSSLAAPKRPRKHRIILRIFKEESDWNVEQVIDRD